MENVIERARILRGTIEEMAQSLEDDKAMENAELFPAWKPDGCEYNPGDRVRVDGTLYKVLQKHTSQPTWNPEEAASLFARVLPGQEGTEIGEWEKPDSTNTYSKEDRVRFNGHIYESLIDNNSWSPEEYPQGWELIE